jgi:hypothetical protein
MSLARFAKKRDACEPAIIVAVENAGWLTWQLDRPADLLCFKPSKGFRVLECKTGRGKKLTVIRDKRQKEQTDFLIQTGTPIVRTPEEALRALGEIA